MKGELRHQRGETFQILTPRKNPPAPETEYARDQGVPAMVRTRTGLDQTGAGGGDGRDRGAKRVRKNHAHQQKSWAPDRPRRPQGAGDGASVLPVAAAGPGSQG